MSDIQILSIVLPTYNSERYLERTFDCLLGQTYRAIEVVVVDDASTDQTVSLIKCYQKQDSRIKLVALNKNQGPGHARNAGVVNATGKYVSFFDHDDLQDKDRYENMISYMRRDKSEVCFSLAKEIKTSTGKVKLLNKNALPEGRIRLPQDIPMLAYKYIPPWRKVYLLDFVRNNGLVFAEGDTKFDDVLFHSLLLVTMSSASMYPVCSYTHLRTGESITDTMYIDETLRNDLLFCYSECLKHPAIEGKKRNQVTKFYYKLLRRHLDNVDLNLYPLLDRQYKKSIIKEGITRRWHTLKRYIGFQQGKQKNTSI